MSWKQGDVLFQVDSGYTKRKLGLLEENKRFKERIRTWEEDKIINDKLAVKGHNVSIVYVSIDEGS